MANGFADSGPRGTIDPAYGRAFPPMVSSLTYRSVLADPPDERDMQRLLARSKVRNRDLGVTGMLLFADGQFLQCLEGPGESVARLWEAIRNDPRHREVELVDHNPAAVRLFGDWDMKFVCREQAMASLRDAEDPSSPLPEALVDTMARLAVDGDTVSIGEGLDELVLMGYERLGLHASLLEPAARRLGDWWSDDLIGSAEVTLGLSYLQTAVRRAGPAHGAATLEAEEPRHILIVSYPGETHTLGPSLASDFYRRAGWRVTVDFPASAKALTAMVRADGFDALSLSLSDVFDRLDRMNAVGETVRAARRASRNPDIVVVVGGRAFRSRPDLAAFLGADAAYASAADAVGRTPRRPVPDRRAAQADLGGSPCH